jgi:hypothetical protein
MGDSGTTFSILPLPLPPGKKPSRLRVNRSSKPAAELDARGLSACITDRCGVHYVEPIEGG